MNCGGISNAQHSSVFVISPLNALIQDQILTMRKGTLNVCVLKGDRLNGDDECASWIVGVYKPKTEDRRPKTEDRRPKTEDRRPKTEDQRPKSAKTLFSTPKT